MNSQVWILQPQQSKTTQNRVLWDTQFSVTFNSTKKSKPKVDSESSNMTPIETIRQPWPVIQYTPRNMHTVTALLCFVVVIHWLIFPYPSGLLHWHCGNLTIAPVPAKQPWWIWINTSCEFIMNDCITTTKQSTTKPCAYFLGYTVGIIGSWYKIFV